MRRILMMQVRVCLNHDKGDEDRPVQGLSMRPGFRGPGCGSRVQGKPYKVASRIWRRPNVASAHGIRSARFM